MITGCSVIKPNVFCWVQDPVYTTTSGEWNEIPDPEWLVRLRQVVQAGYSEGGEAAPADYGGGGEGAGQASAAYGEEAASSLAYDPNQAGGGDSSWVGLNRNFDLKL